MAKKLCENSIEHKVCCIICNNNYLNIINNIRKHFQLIFDYIFVHFSCKNTQTNINIILKS